MTQLRFNPFTGKIDDRTNTHALLSRLVGLPFPMPNVFKGAESWTPAELGSDLKALWDADDLADGSPATWTDKIAGVTLTASGGVTKSSTALNGFGATVHDGIDDCFTSLSFAALPSGSTAGEVWALVDQTETGSGAIRTVVQYGSGSGSGDRGIFRVTTGNGRPRVTNRQHNADHTSGRLEGICAVGGFFSGTSIAGRLNGVPFDTPNTGAASLNTGTVRMRVGARNSAGVDQPHVGKIRFIAATLTLSPVNRQRFEAWMLWSVNAPHRLPPEHPYRYHRP